MRINYDRSSYAVEFAIACMGSVNYDSYPMRISEAPADLTTRTQKLNRALALAKEALGPQEDFEEPFSVTGFRLM